MPVPVQIPNTYYCGENVWEKRCEPKRSIKEQAKTWIGRNPGKCSAIGAGLLGTLAAVAAIGSKSHKPALISAIVGATAVAGTGGYSYDWANKQRADTQIRFMEPCPSAFDSFRYAPDPICVHLPRDVPLEFYRKEPKIPVDPNDPALKNYLYNNIPWNDKCICKDKTMKSRGNLPTSVAR